MVRKGKSTARKWEWVESFMGGEVGLVNGSRWPLGPPDVRSRASQGKGLSGGGPVGV